MQLGYFHLSRFFSPAFPNVTASLFLVQKEMMQASNARHSFVVCVFCQLSEMSIPKYSEFVNSANG